MSSDTNSYFGMDEAELYAMATSRPLRALRSGKADLGGRIRINTVLRSAGITEHESPVRIAGSTNEVWRAGQYIIRVNFAPGSSRLRRESVMAPLLPEEVHYPTVVASGVESFGEWIIVRHRRGQVLSQAWTHMTTSERRSIVGQLAEALQAIHNCRLPDDVARRLAFKESNGELALPHQLPVTRVYECLEKARQLPFMDVGLLNAAEDRLNEVAETVPSHERTGLVHGDLHFENILVADGIITAILDFEWARPGVPEIDLDILSRFLHQPELHVGGQYPVSEHDFRDVLRWLNEDYPALFGHEDLRERLMVCALAFEIPAIVAMPPRGPVNDLPTFHPLNRLRDLLLHGTHAEHLRWEPLNRF